MTRGVWTERPPKQARAAQCAWDIFTRQRGTPKEIWFTQSLDYPVWVCLWPDGETDEIDNVVIGYQTGRIKPRDSRTVNTRFERGFK